MRTGIVGSVRQRVDNARRRHSSRRALIRLAASLAIAAAAVFFLWPSSLGGDTGYITVDGTSMQPRLHTGDLVLVRKQAQYHVGDLVAFSIDGGTVIHRLHSGNDRRGFTTKGDNRTSPDPWVIHPNQIIGRLWFLVPGPVNPFVHLHGDIPLAIVLALLVLYSPRRALRVNPRRRRRLRKELPVPVDIGAPLSRVNRRLLAAGMAGLVVSGLGAWVSFSAFTTPPKTVSRVATGPSQTVAYGYTVHEQPSALAPTGTRTVTAGSHSQPTLFSHLVGTLDLHVAWSVPHGVQVPQGTYGAVATVSSPGMWSKTVPLAATGSFSGSEASFDIPVDLQNLMALGSTVATQTATQGAGLEIKVSPTVRATTAKGRHLVADVPFTLAVNGSAVTPPTTLVHRVAAPSRAVRSTSVVRIGPLTLPVPLARILGPLVGVIALYGLLLAAWRLSRTWDVAIAYRLRSRFASALVKVGAGPASDELLVPVASLDDLARVAACNDGVINVFGAGSQRQLFVRSGSGTYLLDHPSAAAPVRVKGQHRFRRRMASVTPATLAASNTEVPA